MGNNVTRTNATVNLNPIVLLSNSFLNMLIMISSCIPCFYQGFLHTLRKMMRAEFPTFQGQEDRPAAAKNQVFPGPVFAVLSQSISTYFCKTGGRLLISESHLLYRGSQILPDAVYPVLTHNLCPSSEKMLF